MNKQKSYLFSVVFILIPFFSAQTLNVFNKHEQSLNEIFSLTPCKNKVVIDLFETAYSLNNIDTYKFQQVLGWELKHQTVQLILAFTNLRNNTTFDSMLLHWLSGILLRSSSAQDAVHQWRNLLEAKHRSKSDLCLYSQNIIDLKQSIIEKMYILIEQYLQKNKNILIQNSYKMYTTEYGFCLHDARQIDQNPVRSLKQITSSGLHMSIDKKFIPLIQDAIKNNPETPVTDQLKNLRILTTNGLMDSKISFLCHDLFDHSWLFYKLEKHEFLKRYKDFFAKIGNPHMWDIFSREGETIASIGFEYRLYLASHDYRPLFDINKIINILQESIHNKTATENQLRAFSLLSSTEVNQRLLHGLPIIFSGIIIELMEQRRKHGFIQILDEDNNVIDYFNAFDAEYTALIVETCAWLFKHEQSVHDTLTAISTLTEDHLIKVAQEKNDGFFAINLKDIKRAKKKARWFKNNKGFTATRQILSHKVKKESHMKSEFEIKFFIDPITFNEKLSDAGAIQLKPRRLMKRQTFHFHDAENKWARIRDEGDQVTLTLKKIENNNTIDGTKELETVIDSFDTGCKILQETGLIPRSYQENYRETWTLHGCMVTIDEWPGLDPFVEIEGETELDVYRVAQTLGFDITQGLYGSIDLLYQKKLNINPNKFNRLSRLTFDNTKIALASLTS